MKTILWDVQNLFNIFENIYILFYTIKVIAPVCVLKFTTIFKVWHFEVHVFKWVFMNAHNGSLPPGPQITKHRLFDYRNDYKKCFHYLTMNTKITCTYSPVFNAKKALPLPPCMKIPNQEQSDNTIILLQNLIYSYLN